MSTFILQLQSKRYVLFKNIHNRINRCNYTDNVNNQSHNFLFYKQIITQKTKINIIGSSPGTDINVESHALDILIYLTRHPK